MNNKNITFEPKRKPQGFRDWLAAWLKNSNGWDKKDLIFQKIS